MSIPLVILGAGYFALEVTDLIGDMGGNHRIAGYFINDPNGRQLCYPILSEIPDKAVLIAAIISPKRMGFIKKIESQNYRFASVIHPSSSISEMATGYAGLIINRLVAVSAYAQIGKHTIINRCASIGHHAQIGDFCTIGPGANLAGNVRLEAGVTVGMGANILEGRRIGRNSIIGAGAVVTKDIPPNSKAIGIPAKWISL